MPTLPNVSPEDKSPTPDAAWIGFFAEARRLAALAQERRASDDSFAPSARERRDKNELTESQRKRQNPQTEIGRGKGIMVTEEGVVEPQVQNCTD